MAAAPHSHPTEQRPFGTPSRVARDSGSSGESHGSLISSGLRGDSDERLPPPVIVHSARRQAPTPSEQSPLLSSETWSAAKARGAPKYDTALRDYKSSKGRRNILAILHLPTLASLCALIISSCLLSFSLYFIISRSTTAATLAASVLGIVLGLLSVTIEAVRLAAGLGLLRGDGEKKDSQSLSLVKLKSGYHILLHSTICILSVLSFARGSWVLGLLFFLHIGPAALFYYVRVQKEHLSSEDDTDSNALNALDSK